MEREIRYEVSAWIDEADSYKNAPRMLENYYTRKQAEKAAEKAASRFDYVEINKTLYDEQGNLEEGYLLDTIVRV